MTQSLAVKAQKKKERRHRHSAELRETVLYPVQKKIAEALVRCSVCERHGPRPRYAEHLEADHGVEMAAQ